MQGSVYGRYDRYRRCLYGHVVLLGICGEKVYTADDIGTIGYEVVCNISSWVERRYILCQR